MLFCHLIFDNNDGCRRLKFIKRHRVDSQVIHSRHQLSFKCFKLAFLWYYFKDVHAILSSLSFIAADPVDDVTLFVRARAGTRIRGTNGIAGKNEE